jgi:hypothetical protein
MPGKRYTAEQIAKLREAEKSCAAAVPSDRTPTNGKHPREESYRHRVALVTSNPGKPRRAAPQNNFVRTRRSRRQRSSAPLPWPDNIFGTHRV